jgi:hypothetical protein
VHNAALLYTPISLTLARTARGDMLLPEPKRVQGVKASGANGMQRLGDEDEGEGGSEEEEEDGGELHAAGGEEQFGRKLRRLLELYVGSEVRATSLSAARDACQPVLIVSLHRTRRPSTRASC